MSSDVAIKIENLSKCYQIYDTPRDRLKQMLMRGHRQYYREFWALRDVSFEVRKGETVGIIGRNGSGKSTLLQLICGTLNPTSGSIQANGRIAALLELGSGFNPEFTGRENVYMNASVLGLSKEEIDARFEDIVSFADIGDFIEQPIKTYSSGMVVRLAFSVAINVGPEILIVDEALSVGDELFQRKCFSRIETIRAGGTTVLFVSHSGGIIVELCDRAILLDAGDKLAVGTPKQIVGCYQKLIYAPENKKKKIREQILDDNHNFVNPAIDRPVVDKNEQWKTEPIENFTEYFDENLKPSSTIIYESRGALIESPVITTCSGVKVNNIIAGVKYRYGYTVRFTKGVSNVRFGMLIKTTSGVELGGAVSVSSPQESVPHIKEGSVYRVEFRFRCSLNSGIYFLNAGVVGDIDGFETYLHRLIDVAIFQVHPIVKNLATGIVDFDCFSKIEIL